MTTVKGPRGMSFTHFAEINLFFIRKVVEALLLLDPAKGLLKNSEEDTEDNNRTTCLHLAARNGHLDVIMWVRDWVNWLGDWMIDWLRSEWSIRRMIEARSSYYYKGLLSTWLRLVLMSDWWMRSKVIVYSNGQSVLSISGSIDPIVDIKLNSSNILDTDTPIKTSPMITYMITMLIMQAPYWSRRRHKQTDTARHLLAWGKQVRKSRSGQITIGRECPWLVHNDVMKQNCQVIVKVILKMIYQCL